MPAIIQTENLSKKYKDAPEVAIKNITMQIDRGEIYGLLGPNGAGKTSLISILCGLLAPTSGKYWVDGISPEQHMQQIRKIIGIVPQEYALYPTLTARENLMFFGSLYGLKDDFLKKNIDILLERVGLSEFRDRKMGQFSGGMRRRVNLVASVMHRPKLLFLDEPTVGVDVQSRARIIEYLQELNANGMTILYTSHHLMEAEHFCTRISIIDHGRIHASGTPAELIQSVPNARNLDDVFIELTGKELRDAI